MKTEALSASGEIRVATRDDVPEILELLQICLAKTTGIPRSKEFWIWKHFENPFGESPCLLFIADGKIAGLRAFLRWNWTAQSGILTAVRAVDTATHPGWQGKGVFSRLTTTLLEELRVSGTCFVFNTPNSSSLPGYLKMGWRIVTKIPLWIRPLRPLPMLWRYATSASPPEIVSAQHSWPADHVIQDCLDRILTGSEPSNLMHTVRSMAYFDWRYRKIPGFSYSAVAESHSDEAVIVISRERIRKNLRELSISELLLTTHGIASGTQVLQEIISRTNADYAISIAAKATPEETVLKKCGFYNIGKRGPILTYLDLNQCAPGIDLLNWSNWRCSIGDLEIF